MKTFWKFIVFTVLLIQFSFAYSANHDTTISTKKNKDSAFSKESLNTSHFVHPSVERGTPDLKHSNRIPVGLNNNTLLPLFASHKDPNLKIALSEQDIDRCTTVSILLFPFHYFW